MLCTPFLPWKQILTDKESGERDAKLQSSYDGQVQYALAKRGQVLLAERWQSEHQDIKIVEEKFGKQNFRVFSEMRGRFWDIDPTKYKIWIEMG